jgi:hypothetical protein
MFQFMFMVQLLSNGKSSLGLWPGELKTYIINSCAKSAWCARRQHSYNICKDFLSHNSWMKNLNFTNSCTINMNWNIYTIFIQWKTTFFEKLVKTINFNNSTQFEVNCRRSLYKYCMNVDDGRIMRSWRSCLLYMFLAHLAKGQVNFCHYLVFVIRPLSVTSVKLFILKIRVFESAVQIQSHFKF